MGWWCMVCEFDLGCWLCVFNYCGRGTERIGGAKCGGLMLDRLQVPKLIVTPAVSAASSAVHSPDVKRVRVAPMEVGG